MGAVRGQARRSAPSHGVALIAVLWIVAALTIIVTGLSRTVRDEVHLVASARQSVVAQALGDAARTAVIDTGDTLPMPRMSGRYMSPTSGGGTVCVPGVTARTRKACV